MIQEQCNSCKKQNTQECTQSMSFDGSSCEGYEKKLRINLEKQSENNSEESTKEKIVVDTEESTTEPFIITAEYLKANTELSGWLMFFLFSICLGALLSAFYPIITFNSVEYLSVIVSLSDVVLGILMCVLAFYTLDAFSKRKPNAVFLGKMYIVMAFVSNLLLLFFGDYESNGLGSLPQILRSLIWSIIWFSYLCVSRRVNEVIPKEYRKVLNRDYYFMAALILIPLLFWVFGFVDTISNRNEQETKFIQQTVLDHDEYTDGRFVFKCPLGFSCKEEKLTNPQISLYVLENDNVGSITMCCDYDTDTSRNNFESYWNNWKEENASEYQMSILDMEIKYLKGRPYWIKTTRYENSESVIYWRFILLFDKPSGKVCLVSSYDAGYDLYIDELLESIRF